MDLYAATESLRSRPWVGYVLAAILPVLALLARFALGDVPEGFAFLTFFPAILFVAFVGSWRQGCLSIVISTVLAWRFLLEPLPSFTVASSFGMTAMLLFWLVSSAMVLLVDALDRANAELRAAERSARTYHVNLERQVAERTRALARANEQLRASQAHFEAVANLVPDLLWQTDPEGRAVWFNDGWYAYSGQSCAVVQTNGWQDVIHPADLENTLAVVRSGFQKGEPITLEQRIRRKDGVYRWFLSRVRPVIDEGGRIKSWFGAAADINDLKQLQDQQLLLVGELQHRTRNLLGLVHAIAAQTLARSDSAEEFTVRFQERLRALSRVQRFLSGQEGVDIGALLRSELLAHGIDPSQDRVVLNGPEVGITSNTQLTLALAIHELTTNAVKHGAFAAGSGSLEIKWHCERLGDDSDRISLEWRERRFDQVALLKPSKRGFGLDLIERGLPYQLGATTKLDFLADGLICTIDLLLDGAATGTSDGASQAFVG